MPPSKKSTEPVDIETIVERIVKIVGERGGCTISSCKIPKTVRQEVLEHLQSRGLEVTKSTIRRPLRDQLRDALAAGAFLPLTAALRAHVVGATAPEAKKAALDIAARGEAHVVARARTEVLAPRSTSVVLRDQLPQVIKALDAALKLAKKTSKRGSVATILRGDLDALLEPLGGLQSVQTADSSVVDVATALLDPSVGLAFVPTVVRKLAEHSSLEAARASILEAAKHGSIELRPESGLGRLSDGDRALCVPAIDGTPLSWIRVIGGGSA